MVSVGTKMSTFKISRIGRKLLTSDDSRILSVLPKEIPQHTWAEIIEKEEGDLIVFDIREEIIEDALHVAYNNYMDRQMACFTSHCAAQAWLKMIDWYFYRHDPGEEITAGPRCNIPSRSQSWIPDIMPEPSPQDTFSRQDLNQLGCDLSQDGITKWGSSTSLDMNVPAEIPSQCWFPGKVNLPIKRVRRFRQDDSDETSMSLEEDIQSSLIAESEVLQNVIDYTTDEQESKVSIKKTKSDLKQNTPELDGSLKGAGDATLVKAKRILSEKKSLHKSRTGSNLKKLPPIEFSDTVISDCRLRYHRMETQYEVTSEKLNTPPKEAPKRK